MKKRLLTLVAMLLGACIFVFAACSGGSGEIDYAKLDENMTNFKAVYTANISYGEYDLSPLGEQAAFYEQFLVESIMITNLVSDGDLSHIILTEDGEVVGENYYEVDGTKVYEYSQDGDTWYKNESEDPFDSGIDNIKEGDLVKDGSYYVLSEAKMIDFISLFAGEVESDITADDIDYLRFKISDDKITKMEMKFTSIIEIPSGTTPIIIPMIMEITAVFSDFGNATVTLPTVG